MAKHPTSGPRDLTVIAAAELLKLMANPNRLAILGHLVDGEASVGEMEDRLGIRQPTLSQQLGELRKAGLINDRRKAKTVYYSLAHDRARALVKHIHGLFRDAPPATETPPRHHVPRTAPAARANPLAHAAVFGVILERGDEHQAAG